MRAKIVCGILMALLAITFLIPSLKLAGAGTDDISTQKMRGANNFASYTAYLYTAYFPMVSRNGLTTYSSFLYDMPSGAQIAGTGGMLGFGMLIGLFLLSEKPGLPFRRSKR